MRLDSSMDLSSQKSAQKWNENIGDTKKTKQKSICDWALIYAS